MPARKLAAKAIALLPFVGPDVTAFNPPSHIAFRTNEAIGPSPLMSRHCEFVERTKLQRTRTLRIKSIAEKKAIADKTGYLGSLSGDDIAEKVNGVYQIENREQHTAFLQAHPDKLVVMKFYAPWCRACKALEPKFRALANDERFTRLPIVWAEFSAKDQTDFTRSIDVLALPTVQFYEGSNGLIENFPCAPAKVPMLKKKLAQFCSDHVDPKTFKLKKVVEQEGESKPSMEREVLIGNVLVTQEHLDYLRTGLPFFRDLTDEEFTLMLEKARLQTFKEGDIIIRQGLPGRSFFMIKSGLVEMCVKSRLEDPILTPASYLGAVVNQLTKFDVFGERALTTGEPYAASIRVLEKTRCFKFDVEDIPESSILSAKRRASSEMIEQLSERYELPDDHSPTYAATSKNDIILALLVRFKQIRQAAKCFNYILKIEPDWGNKGEIKRRSMLVSKLSNSQREEFREVFHMADVDNRGYITLVEMRRFMESAGEAKTEDELRAMINRANPEFDGKAEYGINLDEFMGVMAEAEFYTLFTDTFNALDKDNTGFVTAGDLDQVLHGVRDLISDDRKSLIDVEDKDIQIDYEQFSKMLLGAAL